MANQQMTWVLVPPKPYRPHQEEHTETRSGKPPRSAETLIQVSGSPLRSAQGHLSCGSGYRRVGTSRTMGAADVRTYRELA